MAEHQRQRNLKSNQRQNQVTYKVMIIKLTMDFSSKNRMSEVIEYF